MGRRNKRGRPEEAASPAAPADQTQAPTQAPVSFSGLVDELGRPNFKDEATEKNYVDAADPKQIEARKHEEGRRRRQDRDFFQLCMSTVDRRASFHRLLERLHVFAAAAIDTGDGVRASDPYRTYFYLGQVSAGRELMLSAMDASLDLYLRMLKEHKEAEDAKREKE